MTRARSAGPQNNGGDSKQSSRMEWDLAGLRADPLAATMWYGSVAGLALFAGYVVRDIWRRRHPDTDSARTPILYIDNGETSYSEL